jgi:DNA polymerase-4
LVRKKTYRKLLYRDEDVLKELTSLCQRVAGSLERNEKKGRTIVLKVRYGDFSTLTKRHSLDEYTDQLDIIEKEVRQLIEEIGQVEKGIRLLGVTVTNFQA